MLMVWIVFLLMHFCTRFTLYSTNGFLSIKHAEVMDLKNMTVARCYWNFLIWTERQIAKMEEWRSSKADISAKVRLQEFKELRTGSIICYELCSSPIQLGRYISSEFKLKKKKKISSLKVIFLFWTVILSLGHEEYNLSWFRRNHFSISGSMSVLKLDSVSAGA